jgi:hypothetical protein
MSYKHRFMYIGLGGTGLKVGTELEQLLRRQICGADGNQLRGKGKFSTYKRDQLPTFFQSVYVDYSQQEMAGLRDFLRELDPTAIDRTTSFVATLSSAAAYQHIAAKLRAEHPTLVSEWLPGSDGEPTHAPMSTGAAQFPTVGRAALFDRLSDVGIEGVFKPMQEAFARLANSQGDLDSYTDVVGAGKKSGHSWVVVFVATSLSGGTGSGLFLDVVKIATAMAQQAFPGTEVFVIPLIAAPSAFKDSASGEQMHMLNLNFARGILDLGELVDHSNSSDTTRERWFRQRYPGASRVEYDITAGGAAAPLATTFLFSRPAAYQDSKDLWRSMAVYATTLVSEADSAIREDATGDMTGAAAPESVDRFAFFQDIINLRSKNDTESLRTLHPTGIGRLSLVEAATASLSVPVKRLSFFLAQLLALRAAESLHESLRSHENSYSDFVSNDIAQPDKEKALHDVVAKLPKAEPVQTLINVLDGDSHAEMEWADGMDTLRDHYRSLERKADPAKRGEGKWRQLFSSAVQRVSDTGVEKELDDWAERLIQEAMSSLTNGWIEGIKRYQEEPGESSLGVIETVTVLRLMVDQKILARFEKPEESHPYQAIPTASAPGRRETLLRQDVSKDKAVSNLKKLRAYYMDQYRRALIRAWGRARLRQEELRAVLDSMRRWHDEAVAGIHALRDRKAQIESGWNTLTAGANNAGFRDWVPSRLTSRGSGNKLEKAETLLRDVFAVAVNSNAFSLDSGGAWRAYSKALQSDFSRVWERGAYKPDSIVHLSVDAFQRMFDDALESSAEGRPALLTTVEDVLRVAAGVVATRTMEGAEEDVRELGKALSELIPDGLIPDAKDCKKAFIVVTYPGRQIKDVEKYLEDRLHGNASLSILLARSEIKFHASSTTDAITISVALALRGVMDIQEARNAIRMWDTAYHVGGQMMKWRQRTSVAELARLSAVRDQLPVLQSLLHMVWDDHVSYYVLDKGVMTRADANSVRLQDIAGVGIPIPTMMGPQGSTNELPVKLDRVGKLSGISTFMENYLRVILDLYCDSQSVDAEIVATKVSSYLARGFADADSASRPSNVFRQLVDEIGKSEGMVAAANTDAERIDMPGPIGQARHARQFYADEVVRAFEQKHPRTPDSARRKNLTQFWEQAESGKR